MARPVAIAGMIIVGLATGLVLNARSARAIEVKKSLYGGAGAASSGGAAPAPANTIPPALRQKLGETIAQESETYLDQESEKKSSGEAYIDLEGAKFKYFPQSAGGKTQVTAKLEGAEFKPSKAGEGKGRATGKHRALVFKYRLDGQNWTEVSQPAWEDIAEKGAKAARQ